MGELRRVHSCCHEEQRMMSKKSKFLSGSTRRLTEFGDHDSIVAPLCRSCYFHQPACICGSQRTGNGYK